MADQELIKHTKKVYKIWSDKDHTIWHKLGEFGIEVVTIVFAVSLSIWLHDRSEYAHEQKEAKAFLIGLRADLIADSSKIARSKAEFLGYGAAYSYICSIRMRDEPSPDSIKKYGGSIFDFTDVIASDGRFQGFKSSGKIGTIENKKLENDIIELYEEDNPVLKTTVEYYNNRKNKVFEYFMANEKRLTDSTDNDMALLKTDEFRNWCASLTSVSEIIERYDHCLVRMRKIISNINKEYGPEEPVKK